MSSLIKERLEALDAYSIELEMALWMLVNEQLNVERKRILDDCAPLMGHSFSCPVHPTNYTKAKRENRLKCLCGLYEIRRRYGIEPKKRV